MMKKTVKARHMKMTEALHTYVEKKLLAPLEHIADRPDMKVDVELCDEGNIKECRVHIFISGVEPVNIHESNADLYRAIDLAEPRMLIQVKRHRDRMRHHQHREKQAAYERHATARAMFTAEPEPWEREVQEYERTAVGQTP
jgi:ribosomal subunit interface protein